MAITAAGIKHLAQAVVGQGTAFNTANAHIGVGDGTAEFAVDQVDLQGTSKYRKKVDAGYPVVEAPTVTFRAIFEQNEAVFPWNEWAVFNAATGGVMLSRVVEGNGVKQSNQTWVLEVAVTFAVGE